MLDTLRTLAIAMPLLVTGCATDVQQARTASDHIGSTTADASSPVTIITKQEVDAFILKQWAPSDMAIFRKSALSEGELRMKLEVFAIPALVGQISGESSDLLGDCPTIKLIDIEVVNPGDRNGLVIENWKVDLCSEAVSFPIIFKADRRAAIAENPQAYTLPSGFFGRR